MSQTSNKKKTSSSKKKPISSKKKSEKKVVKASAKIEGKKQPKKTLKKSSDSKTKKISKSKKEKKLELIEEIEFEEEEATEFSDSDKAIEKEMMVNDLIHLDAKKEENEILNLSESLSVNDNTLSLYLAEINKIPLLTREEENYLAKKVADENNENAKERLINANLRFVVSVAKKYQISGISLLDLINEGNLGLIKSVEKFDYTKGFHFISYAVWWIKQSILKAIAEKSRLVRLPLNRANELKKIEDNISALSSNLNRTPSIAEIAEDLDMDDSDVSHLLSLSQSYISIDSPISNDNSKSFIEIIKNSKAETPERNLEYQSLQETLDKVLSTLSQKEKTILECRYGIGGQTKLSLEKIGKRFSLSKERIRQIEKNAIRKLKSSTRKDKLKDFLNL